jgi:hypothetical protein
MNNRRLLFKRADVQRDADGVIRANVSFSLSETVIDNFAVDSETNNPLRAAALATLGAVERAVDGRFVCVLADVDRVSALGKDLIAVLVNVDFEGKQFQLFGSCQVAGNEVDAAVKAALNATNRFVELALES